MNASNSDRLLHGLLIVTTAALGLVIWDAIRDRSVTVGDQAPDFEIRTDAGLTLSPASFGGKVLVLNFWATWCPPCVQETPELEALHKELKDSGVVVLGISVDKNEKKYKDFLRRFGVTYQTARDPEAVIGDRFRTYKYPETYVIDRTGKVVQKIVGLEWNRESLGRFLKSLATS
jgi:cytochrome c biogenesis protein CcmG, thiol:disulfide interchange protein DsbE